MRIRPMSDLHLEFSDFVIKNDDNAEVLVLAGDIMCAQDLHDHPEPPTGRWPDSELDNLGARQRKAQVYRDFLQRCSDEFPHVIICAGNHEFYNGKFFAGIDYLRDACNKFPNIHFLENDAVTIGDVTFVGGTLWTDMNKGDPITLHSIRDMITDFKSIRNDSLGYTKLAPINTAIRHKATVKYLGNTIDENANKKFVVVTHHSPSFASMDPKYASTHVMNGAYYSDLSEFILDRPQITTWIHGHSHYAVDYSIGSTRIVCNPRGYELYSSKEDTGWDSSMIVEV